MNTTEKTASTCPIVPTMESTPWARSTPGQRVALVVVIAIWAIVLVFLGVLSITTQEAYIYASRSKSVVKGLMVYGTQAVWYGVMKIAMGLVMVALLMPSKRAAMWWLSTSLCVLLVSAALAIWS